MMNKRGIRALGLVLAMVLLLGVAPMARAAVQPLTFEQASYTALIGFTTTVKLVPPAGGELPSDVYFALKKEHKKYASVDAQTGVVTPKRAGKIYVYAVSPSLGSKATGRCKLVISNNVYTWKAQKNSSYKAYASPKRLYHLDGAFVGEMYIWNNYFRNGLTQVSGTPGNLTWVLVDTAGAGGGTVIGYADLGKKIKFKSRIGKNKFGTVKAKFKTDLTTVPDLTTGRYTVVWLAWDTNVIITGYKGLTLGKTLGAK